MSRERILVADDDPLITQDLRDRLEILDYQVAGTAASAEEATALADRVKPDLVLMDILMPGNMDGVQAAQHLRSRRIPFVYVTGYSEGPVLERAMQTQPYGYLIKPYETNTLKTTIEVGLGRHRADEHNQRQLQETRRALAEAKRLSGLISICAYCKKVKEEDNTWTQIETYIMRRAPVSFTHGMCQDCFQDVKDKLEAAEQGILPAGSIILG